MKPKILIRIGSLRHGGAEKVLTTFLQNLDENKYEIDLLLNLYSGKYLKSIPSWINIKYLNKGEMITTNRVQDIPQKAYRVLYQSFLKRFPKVLYKNVLEGKIYDIEFAAIHGISDEIISSPNPDSKKVVWIHNDLSEVEGYTAEKIRRLFQFDRIMVISEKIEKMFSDAAKTQEERDKIVRIYNPIDTEEIQDLAQCKIENADIQEFIQDDSRGPLFVSVGTVFPQKGFDRLLRAHSNLLDQGLSHRVLVVGDGYDMPNILKLRKELGVEDSSQFVGFQENPYPLFQSADFFIMPSRYEGFPTVLYEALVLKKNIIATDVSGVAEILDHGNLGMIIENNEEAIEKAMKEAIEQAERFETYQKNISNFEAPFTLENSVERIERILDEL